MRGLIQLTVEKLHSDLPTLQFDDYVFSHSIDEALGFNKEVVESYNYPSTQPGILSVLTRAQVFMKWLAMEKKCKSKFILNVLQQQSYHHWYMTVLLLKHLMIYQMLWKRWT